MAPEVQAWMKAEDDETRKRLAILPERDAIAARLRELLYVDSQVLPRRRTWPARLLLNGALGPRRNGSCTFLAGARAEGSRLEGYRPARSEHLGPRDGSSTLQDWSVSWDGKRVAYSVSENNSDEATMHVMDVESLGKVSTNDVIEGAKYAHASWTPRGTASITPSFRWIPRSRRTSARATRRCASTSWGPSRRRTSSFTRRRVTRRRSSAEASSKDGRWLIATRSRAALRSDDVYFRDLTKPTKAWTPLVEGSTRSSRWSVVQGDLLRHDERRGPEVAGAHGGSSSP